ncbi:hypothetical protein LshimejAT787_0506880 [Lyophyllum shimeji]|uniref:Uncharacterized protein n=1 Tax=Lyophyllum shimeji TaxID=47721 RepID=A0A9P3PNS2_LYOSH|nr:hypothetical protein LshimejAT787_0506880 [Lyophyllum shimeji]
MLISTDVVCHHLSLYLFVVRCCGPHIYFAGAAWNGDRPNIQVLLPALPFHMHESDTTLRAMAARHLGAYRKAYESLKHYYDEELPSMDPSTFPAERVLFPYPTQFTAVDGTTQAFDYVAQVDPDKLIFFGRLRDGGDEVCIIKLARRYSREVREFCGLLDIAPRLRGFDKIPGGWYMVVMDQIGEEYTSYEEFRDSSNFDTARASLLRGAIWKGL